MKMVGMMGIRNWLIQPSTLNMSRYRTVEMKTGIGKTCFVVAATEHGGGGQDLREGGRRTSRYTNSKKIKLKARRYKDLRKDLKVKEAGRGEEEVNLVREMSEIGYK